MAFHNWGIQRTEFQIVLQADEHVPAYLLSVSEGFLVWCADVSLSVAATAFRTFHS